MTRCEQCNKYGDEVRTVVFECSTCMSELEVGLCEPCIRTNDNWYVDCQCGREVEVQPLDWWDEQEHGYGRPL